MATFVNQTSNIGALGPKFEKALSVGGGSASSSSSSSNDVDRKSAQAQQFLSSLHQRTVFVGHEIEETTTYLLPPAVVEEEEQENDSPKEEIKTISELATLTRSAQRMTSSKIQTLMKKLGINAEQLLKDKNSNTSLPSPSSTVATSSDMKMVGITPQRGGRRPQGRQHHQKYYYQGTTMSPRSHPITPSASPVINRRNNKHHFGSSLSSSSSGTGGDLFSNLQLSSSPSSLLSNLLLDGPLESVAEADYETDTTTPASSSSSSIISPSTSTTRNAPASSSWSAYKSTKKKNSSGSSDYNRWNNIKSVNSSDQRQFSSPRNVGNSSRVKSFHSPSRWSATKKKQPQKSSSTSPLTPPPMNSLSFSNSTSTFLQQHNITNAEDNPNNSTTMDQQNDCSDPGELQGQTNNSNNIFSPYDSSPLSSSSSLHDTATAASNRPKTPAAAVLLRPSPTLPNVDGNSPNINNKNNINTDKTDTLSNFLPLHRALNFEFREDDDMITLDTQSTLGTVLHAPSSTTKQTQSQSQSSSSQGRRRASSMTSTSTTGGGGGGRGNEGGDTLGEKKRAIPSSATKEDHNNFLARMEGMLERVEESMMDDNRTTNSSFLNNDLDEPSRPSDEMNASMFRRNLYHHRHKKSLIREVGSASLQSAPTTTSSSNKKVSLSFTDPNNNIDDDGTEEENDDPSDSSSNDDSTNLAPTVVQDKEYNSSRVQRHGKLSSAAPVGEYKERPTTHIVVDQSLPSPAHTNITMDNTMLTAAEFGGLEDFELPVMKNIGMGQKKNRMSIYKSTTYPSLGTSSNIDESENDPDLDCLSVLTPVLDRYRVEPGGDNSSDIKVIPNQRRPHPSHEAYRKKKITVKHRVDVGTGTTPNGGFDSSTGDDEYQGITPIMSNVPTVSAFQSPPPSTKITSTPVSSVTSRKKKVYPKTPIPGKVGSKTKTGTGGENAHPNTHHRNSDNKKKTSFLSPVGNERTDDAVGGEFVVPRLRPSALDSNKKRTRGRRASNAQLASAGRQPSGAVDPKLSTATPSSSLARAQRNWESLEFSSSSSSASFAKNDERYRSVPSSVEHESGRTNPVGVRLSKSPL